MPKIGCWRRNDMLRRSLYVFISSVWVLALMFSVTQDAFGEKIRFHSQHVNVATKSETIEVGDEPGHTISMFRAKGVGIRREGPAEPAYKIEIWGTGDHRGDGTGKEHGYGKFTFLDGSSYYEKWSSQVSGGHDVGTAVYFNGTGRFKGMKGESKFDCTLLGDRFICEVEGTIELP